MKEDIDRLQERMGKKPQYGGGFDLKDNTQASKVRDISTMSQKYDMKKCKYHSDGSKGYPSQAIQENSMKY